IFPYLVTGWVTAAGGAWNTSIIAEYVTYKGQPEHVAWGLGAQISLAVNPPAEPTAALLGGLAATQRPPLYAALAASVLVMALMVVLFNRLVWRRLFDLAEKRFSLSK